MRRNAAMLAFVATWALASWLVLAPRPLDMAPPDIPGLDKLVHVVLWGLLAITTWSVLALTTWPRRRWRPWVVWALTLGYGVAVEVIQAALPRRSAELADVVADAAGVLLGVALMSWWERRNEESRAHADRGPARHDVELPGMGPGGGPEDAAQQPRPSGR